MRKRTGTKVAATASYHVGFPLRKGQKTLIAEPAAARPSRLALQLAMAYKIDGMIRRGEIKNMAEAARLAHVTRARLTQISNLLLLSPAIQSHVLGRLDVAHDPSGFTERVLRRVSMKASWNSQEKNLLLPRCERQRS